MVDENNLNNFWYIGLDILIIKEDNSWQIFAYMDRIFPILLSMLSDTCDDVLLLDLQLLSDICEEKIGKEVDLEDLRLDEKIKSQVIKSNHTLLMNGPICFMKKSY